MANTKSSKQTKFIFVTGGVVSSLGKGVTTAALGRILKARGIKVSVLKIDPYINIDPGTMNPYEHGEVFVTTDGAETDQDLGHYERFIDEELVRESNFTTGQVYLSLIEAERRGDYLGKTVEEVPHVTDEIIRRIKLAAEKTGADVLLVELGSTVGDIKGAAFIEAFRQMRHKVGHKNTLFVHVTLLPYMETTGELKTRPTQYGVRELMSLGIPPHILVCRAEKPIPEGVLDKIAATCDVDRDAVVPMVTTRNIYEVPVKLEEQGLGEYIDDMLGLGGTRSEITDWAQMVEQIEQLRGQHSMEVAIVGKYVELNDAYISVSEAIKAAALANDTGIKIRWVNSEEIEQQGTSLLEGVAGVVVPGGFGDRGIEGKIMTARWARENKIPYLGLCLGMQIMTIEFARHLLLDDESANSAEFNPEAKHKVVDLMEHQKSIYTKGGTMRLGNYRCKLLPGTKAREAYGAEEVVERHRHRFEFNNEYREQLEAAGLKVSGTTPDDVLVEIVEIPDHPFMLGTQAHPEFRSRPNRAHPLFNAFVKAAIAEHAPVAAERRRTKA